MLSGRILSLARFCISIFSMVRKFGCSLLVVLVTFSAAYSQRMSRQDYIQNYQLLAIKEMNRSGIPASIKLAQACLESDDGNSALATASNNHFGIKCKSTWTGDYVLADDDEKNECFRKYSSVEESYIDHTNFLAANQRYAFLFQISPKDYKGWARGLKAAGYATARDYPERLIRIIEDFELYRLDEKVSPEELLAFEQRKLSNSFDNNLSINPYKTRDVLKINGLKAIIAREGDTFDLIAQEFGKSPWELYRFNDYQEGYQPQPDEVLYLQSKHRKTGKKQLNHLAGPDESLHYIAQIYGIKLKPLMRRNHMKSGDQVQPGQIIALR